MSVRTSPFTDAELATAREQWGCNCGPAALAFALGVKLEAARYALPTFADKRHTTPTMMMEALRFLNRGYRVIKPPPRPPNERTPPDIESLFLHDIALVHLQFTGPWTAPGANARWAYTHTHWVACWRERQVSISMVYDVNAGGSASGGVA
jgi:hypothetical protein